MLTHFCVPFWLVQQELPDPALVYVIVTTPKAKALGLLQLHLASQR
jgi:hypothetical protein